MTERFTFFDDPDTRADRRPASPPDGLADPSRTPRRGPGREPGMFESAFDGAFGGMPDGGAGIRRAKTADAPTAGGHDVAHLDLTRPVFELELGAGAPIDLRDVARTLAARNGSFDVHGQPAPDAAAPADRPARDDGTRGRPPTGRAPNAFDPPAARPDAVAARTAAAPTPPAPPGGAPGAGPTGSRPHPNPNRPVAGDGKLSPGESAFGPRSSGRAPADRRTTVPHATPNFRDAQDRGLAIPNATGQPGAANVGTAGRDAPRSDRDAAPLWATPVFSAPQRASKIRALDLVLALTPETPDREIRTARLHVRQAFGDDPGWRAGLLAKIGVLTGRQADGSRAGDRLGAIERPEAAARQREAELLALRQMRQSVDRGEDYDETRRNDGQIFGRFDRATGLRTGPDGLGGVRFLGEDGAPFLTLSRVYAREIAAHPDLMAPRLALLRDWHTGKLTGAALEARVRELYVDVIVPDANEVVGSVGGLEILNAVRAADAHARTVEHRERAIALLAPALLPVPLDARDLAVGVLIGVLPVVSQVDAGLEAAASFRDADAALNRGDYGTAIALTALGLVSLASLTPGAGALLRPLSRVLTRAIRTTPGLRFVHSRVALARALKRADETAGEPVSPKEVFGDAWKTLSASEQKTMRGLFSNIAGQAGEQEAEDLLRAALFKTQASKAVRNPETGRLRIYDHVIETGFRNVLGVFVFKHRGRRHSAAEVKTNTGQQSRETRQFDDRVRQEGAVTEPTDEFPEGLPIDHVDVIRLRLDQIPIDTIEREFRRLLGQRAGLRFSPEQADAMLAQLKAWHAKAETTGMSIGQALALLGAATTAMVEAEDAMAGNL